mmetsp:Transcript_5844/g.13851  ORF Transcript_5844/g.13851 Transcript_5844/m.13851 type:complete len:248 (+) Transcript_5844:264-1007(+)
MRAEQKNSGAEGQEVRQDQLHWVAVHGGQCVGGGEFVVDLVHLLVQRLVSVKQPVPVEEHYLIHEHRESHMQGHLQVARRRPLHPQQPPQPRVHQVPHVGDDGDHATQVHEDVQHQPGELLAGQGLLGLDLEPADVPALPRDQLRGHEEQPVGPVDQEDQGGGDDDKQPKPTHTLVRVQPRVVKPQPPPLRGRHNHRRQGKHRRAALRHGHQDHEQQQGGHPAVLQVLVGGGPRRPRGDGLPEVQQG